MGIRDYSYLATAFPLQRKVQKDGRKGMIFSVDWTHCTLDPINKDCSCKVAWLVDGKYDAVHTTSHTGQEVLAMLKPGFASMPAPYLDNLGVVHWLMPLYKNKWKMEESEFEAARDKAVVETEKRKQLGLVEGKRVNEVTKQRRIASGVIQPTFKQKQAAKQKKRLELEKLQKKAAAAAAAAGLQKKPAAGNTAAQKATPSAAAAAAAGGSKKPAATKKRKAEQQQGGDTQGAAQQKNKKKPAQGQPAAAAAAAGGVQKKPATKKATKAAAAAAAEPQKVLLLAFSPASAGNKPAAQQQHGKKQRAGKVGTPQKAPSSIKEGAGKGAAGKKAA